MTHAVAVGVDGSAHGDEDHAGLRALDGAVELGGVIAADAGHGGLVLVVADVAHGDAREVAGAAAVVQRGRVGHDGFAQRHRFHGDVEGDVGIEVVGHIGHQVGEEAFHQQIGRGAHGDDLRALGNTRADDLHGPGAGLRIVDLHLLDVVDVVFLGLDRGVAGVAGIKRPGVVPRAAGAGNDKVEVVDQGVRGEGHRRVIVPGDGDLKFGVARGDVQREAELAAVADRFLAEAAAAEEVDGVLGADGAIAVLHVRAGVTAVVGGVGQEDLHGRVAEVGGAREEIPIVLEQESANTTGRRRRHGGAAERGVGGVAGAVAGGDAAVGVALATGGGDVRLEATVIRRAPTGEAGDGIVVGVQGADGDVVLGAGGGRGGVIGATAVGGLPLVAVGPEDEVGVAQAAAHDRVDQVRGNAVVAGDIAGETVAGRVGADGVVGDVGPVGVHRLVVVALDVAGIAVEEDSRAVVLKAVRANLHTGGHALVVAVGDAPAADRAGDVRGVVVLP